MTPEAQDSKKIRKTEAEWQSRLTPEQYEITREKGTERAFTGALYKHKEAGTYTCVCCGAPLFSSDAKYESGSGWPSFCRSLAENGQDAVESEEDHSHGMIRTEIRCARCDAHLGHVFTDGPQPTGLRYCVNSASLGFQGEQKDSE